MCLARLQDMYDGYHFCADAEGVYNPFSLLNALQDKQFNDYWFETGTPSFLVSLIKNTAYDSEVGLYRLDFPNREVKNGFLSFVLEG